MEMLKRGRGRPKIEGKNRKEKAVKVRMTDDEFETLDFVSEQLKRSRPETVRLLIQEAYGLLYNQLKNDHENGDQKA